MSFGNGGTLSVQLPAARLLGLDPLPETGTDNGRRYARVAYQSVFPGIDLVVYGNGQGIDMTG
jgi:hypothetical protein